MISKTGQAAESKRIKTHRFVMKFAADDGES
jgi:hypothetical protein